MTTADGVVTFTGWRGGGGNAVEIRHAGAFVTAYLHLSRFASGIRPGVRVVQGQVIGYVGTTGLSTGPHLDYRVTQNGRYRNPLGVGRDPAPPLPKAELPRFAGWAEPVLPLLGRPGRYPGKRVVAQPLARGGRPRSSARWSRCSLPARADLAGGTLDSLAAVLFPPRLDHGQRGAAPGRPRAPVPGGAPPGRIRHTSPGEPRR